ncbi:MAG: 4Fe-4S binding protein [Clostridia bacterium]|nr:4Fe-4S binding protein [Clostridia bacterium]
MRKYLPSIIIPCVFEAVAVTLWLLRDNIFYLFNFTYIGVCIAAGLFLFAKKKPYARRFIQFAVGLYMLVYLGFICRENMQIEGFWYYLFLGVFEAATIHYAVAKIFGPFIFGRGWCGYACWTAMILDLLPYKRPAQPRKKLGFIKYIVFVLSLLLVGGLIFSHAADIEDVMFYLFIAGNAAYYAVGIILAFAFKDNRAFCKYFCPVAVFLKPTSYFSMIRVHCDEDKCVKCGKCLKVCPMDVEVNKDSRKRKNASDCILCQECVKSCPTRALRL